ncbi:hypothetical protein [Pseudonocardia sp. ICBG601]|uniref:hypothetical protein n=1 Tax=Pseudonocardia sp. ICBG601 TaxID=2846759 RepID=UPI001CF66720|nr:hypothetical protein [Pseudonocardia sp. ICBG601]
MGAAIAAGLDALFEVWDWTPEDTVAHGLPLFHVHGLILGVLGSLRLGSRVVHTVKPQPARYGRGRRLDVLRRPHGLEPDRRRARRRPCPGPGPAPRLGSAPLPRLAVRPDRRPETGQAPVERYGMPRP